MEVEKIYKNLIKVKEKQNFDLLDDILLELKTEITCNGKINKGIISNFKSLINRQSGERPIFKQIFINNENHFIICNGFVLIDYGTDINNIPLELRDRIDCKIKSYEKPTFSYDKLKNTQVEEFILKIEDIKKIINYNKTIKDKRNYVLLSVGNSLIDSKMLYETLVCTGNNFKKMKEIKVYSGNKLAPTNIEFDNCQLLILPINYDENQKRYNDEKLKEIGIKK